jgi:hypothetical protein
LGEVAFSERCCAGCPGPRGTHREMGGGAAAACRTYTFCGGPTTFSQRSRLNVTADRWHGLALGFGGEISTAMPWEAQKAINAPPLNPLSASRPHGSGPAPSSSGTTEARTGRTPPSSGPLVASPGSRTGNSRLRRWDLRQEGGLAAGQSRLAPPGPASACSDAELLTAPWCGIRWPPGCRCVALITLSTSMTRPRRS